MKRIALAGAGCRGAAAAFVAIGGVYKMNRFMDTPVDLPEGGANFEIAPGSSFATVTAKLVEQGVIENDFWYRLYARKSGEASGIQAGEYLTRTRCHAAHAARAIHARRRAPVFVHDHRRLEPSRSSEGAACQ